MSGKFEKAPALKRPVHVKLPKPTNVVDYPAASQELTDAYFQHFCTATFTGM